MARYFFNLSDKVFDTEGHEFPTLEAAKDCAIQTAYEVARNRPQREVKHLSVCVTDESGREVFRTPLVADSLPLKH